MTDYNKLTVVKLREELVRRGLPKSGLKPVLVNRLIEADVQIENEEAVRTSSASETPTLQHDHNVGDVQPASEAPVKDTSTPILSNNDKDTTNNAPIQVDAAHSQTDGKNSTGNLTQDDLQNTEPKATEAMNSPVIANELQPTNKRASITEVEPVINPSKEPIVEQTLIEAPGTISKTKNEIGDAVVAQDALDTIQPEPLETDRNETVFQSSATHVDAALNDAPALIASESSAREEMLEDTKKRKRRSQSPPPSVAEIAQKRAKMEDLRPVVVLPEDLNTQDSQFQKSDQIDDAVMNDAAIADPPDLNKNSQPTAFTPKATVAHSTNVKLQDDVSETLPPDKDDHGFESKPQPNSIQTPAQTSGEEIPSKHSPQDTRFKNLFTAAPKRSVSPSRQVPRPEYEDRNISPALHPATSALYIRDFMRPLHPSSLKDHLIALAAPSSSTPSPEIITEFFLDPIRTHCLVGFSSISAASRVRSSLHDRVWPDERTRRPLWVDFVPEEKLQRWIEVETEATGSRGHGAKRWEVIYEEEASGIKAYLQEAGSGPRPPPQHPARADVGLGVSGAPSGPRGRTMAEPRGPPPPPTPQPPSSVKPADISKGFQALDDLFESTSAKPKLYYLPVSKSVANRRLDRLDEGRGGGRGDELRRYTFEDSILVDRGPESPRRGHGGYASRGTGGGGGYRPSHVGVYSGGSQGRDGGGYGRRGGGGYRGSDRRDWR